MADWLDPLLLRNTNTFKYSQYYWQCVSALKYFCSSFSKTLNISLCILLFYLCENKAMALLCLYGWMTHSYGSTTILFTIQLHPSLVTGAIQIQLTVKTPRLAQRGGEARRVMRRSRYNFFFLNMYSL